MITCRYCDRPIERSPATGLWWAADGSEPDCPHEPREADSEEMAAGPDVVVTSGGLASPWDFGPYSHNRPARRPSWRWGA